MYKPKHFIKVLRQKTERKNINALAAVTESLLVCQPWTWNGFKHGHGLEEGRDFVPPHPEPSCEESTRSHCACMDSLSTCSSYNLEKVYGTSFVLQKNQANTALSAVWFLMICPNISGFRNPVQVLNFILK